MFQPIEKTLRGFERKFEHANERKEMSFTSAKKNINKRNMG